MLISRGHEVGSTPIGTSLKLPSGLIGVGVLAGSDALVLDPRDTAGTTAALERCYRLHREGRAPSGAGNRERFARARRGTELLRLLEEIGWRAAPST